MADAITAARGKAFVQVLSCVLSRLVDANDRAPEQSTGVVTKFHALRPPSISIRDYLERINKYASCSPECFVLALVYIDRLIQRNHLALTSLNVHRIIITAVMMAAKFFDDQYFNNAYYAKVGGVPCNEINSLELEFLFSINFSLHVTTDVYERYFAELSNHMGVGLPPDVLAATLATQTCACAKFSEGLKFGHEEVCYTGMRPPEVLAAESGAVAAAASVSAAGATIGVVPVGAGAGSGTAGGSSSGDVMMVEAGAVSVATSMHEQAHRHHQQQCSSAAHDNSDMMESERHARGGTAASTAGSSSGVEGSSYSISSGRHMRGGDAGSNSSSGGGGGRCNWNVEVDSCSGRTGRRQGGQLDSASSSSNRQGRSAAMEFDLPSAER